MFLETKRDIFPDIESPLENVKLKKNKSFLLIQTKSKQKK